MNDIILPYHYTLSREELVSLDLVNVRSGRVVARSSMILAILYYLALYLSVDAHNLSLIDIILVYLQGSTFIIFFPLLLFGAMVLGRSRAIKDDTSERCLSLSDAGITLDKSGISISYPIVAITKVVESEKGISIYSPADDLIIPKSKIPADEVLQWFKSKDITVTKESISELWFQKVFLGIPLTRVRRRFFGHLYRLSPLAKCSRPCISRSTG